MTITEATEKAIDAATHLTDMDLGAVQMLRALAAAADAIDTDGLNPAGKLDNVTIPTYLRYAESLGLTPAGRERLGDKPKEGPRGKLSLLQDGAGKKKRTA